MGLLFSKRVPKDMDEVKKNVDTLIRGKPIVVFSKSYCIFCKRLRRALESFEIKEDAIEWIEIDKRDDCPEIQAYMLELTGAKTVPRVFIGGNFEGGCDQILAAKKSGELERLLRNADAI